MERPLTVTRLARRAGLQPSTVRYYEANGIVRARRLPNGYRVFDEEALRALRFTRSAKALGFSLADIVEILELSRTGAPPCGCVRETLARNLRSVDQRMGELRALRRHLRAALQRTPETGRTGVICPLIEA
jgi:DNA-binding transcriptional MerR regulator